MFEKQLEGFEKFKKLKVGALFMQMGSGKTKVAIDLVNYNKVDLLIYVCPHSIKGGVVDEIEKWGISCPYTVSTYEAISMSDTRYLELLAQIKGRCFIIADESIFIKNEESKRFNRLVELRKKCEYALVLNGTPLTKNEWDLYNQMYFLSPIIINMTRVEFLNNFFKKVAYKKKGEKEKTFYSFSEVNASYLQKLIDPYTFNCELDFLQKEETNYEYIEDVGEEYEEEKLASLEAMKQDFTYCSVILMLQRLNITSALNPSKNDKVIEYARGRQVIIYCQFLKEVNYLQSNMDCYVIVGGSGDREETIRAFKKDNKPLIMTLGVGSYGLNLQFCNEIIYTSLSFDYGKMEQSKYRIKRIGQDRDIKYTYILSDVGINTYILKNLDRKKDLASLVIEKIQAGGIEEWVRSI